MKRLLLMSLLLLGCLGDLKATLALRLYPSYDAYIAAIDSGNFSALANVQTSPNQYVSGLSLAIQKEGPNGPHVQKIQEARKALYASLPGGAR